MFVSSGWFILFLAMWGACGAGLIRRNRYRDNESVETLLAVGLIAKALADAEMPQKQCPLPVQVTKIVQVPVLKERIVVVGDNECQAHKYHGNKHEWGEAAHQALMTFKLETTP